jgi:hypothetical protein
VVQTVHKSRTGFQYMYMVAVGTITYVRGLQWEQLCMYVGSRKDSHVRSYRFFWVGAGSYMIHQQQYE